MKWLVDPDSAFYSFINFFADVVILSLFCFLLSIPIITIGAAHTAMCCAVAYRVQDKKTGIKEFLRAFIKNFVPATLIWMCVSAGVLFIFSLCLLLSDISFLLPVIFFLVLELIFLCIYIFPVIATQTKKESNMIDIIKLSFFLAHKNLLTTLFCSFLATILLTTCFFYPLLFLIVDGLYNFLAYRFITKTLVFC